MAGNLSVESCGNLFAPASKKASSNYGIGTDGRIALYVEEKDRSWASSNAANDHRAITIEVANDGGAPDWHVSDKALSSLIDLITDICKRNNIKQLLWKADKALIGQVDKQNMTVHRWFAAKACPGDYLYNKHYYIADEVNKRLNTSSSDTKLYRVRRSWNDASSQLGAFEILANAKSACIRGYSVFDDNGNIIYSNMPIDVPASTPNTPQISYVVGKTYTLQSEMKVRTGAGTNYSAKKHNQLTSDGMKHDKDKDGALDKGTVVTCKEVKQVNNDTWIRTPSGWIAAIYQGKVYIK